MKDVAIDCYLDQSEIDGTAQYCIMGQIIVDHGRGGGVIMMSSFYEGQKHSPQRLLTLFLRAFTMCTVVDIESVVTLRFQNCVKDQFSDGSRA